MLTTPNNQDILQDRQRCSKPTKDVMATLYLSHPFKAINAITHHSRPIMDHSNPPRTLLSLLQDHLLCSRSTHTNPDYFMSTAATSDHRYYPPLLQNYAGPVKASQTTPDDQDLLQDQQHCSRPTTTSPGNFILIPATPDYHRHHHGPLKASQSFPE